MMNNNYFGQGFSTMGMTERPVMNQTLTKEEIQKLRSDNKGWNLSISEEDCLRQMCTHKDPNTGGFSLIDNEDGTCTCTICGERFSMVTLTDEEVQECFADANDIFQTAKTNYGAIPPKVGRGFYRLGAFMKKMPEFYRMAQEYRKKWAGADDIQRNNAMSDWQKFGMLTNPFATGFGQPQMGGFGQMPQAPMAGNYGMMAAQAQTPMQMPQAPMGYGQAAQAPMQMPQAPVMDVPAAAQNGFNTAMPNPAMGPAPQADRPVGVVEPAAPATGDVKKAFKA